MSDTLKYIIFELTIRVKYLILQFILLFCIIFCYCEEFLYILLTPTLNFFLPNFIFTHLFEIMKVYYELTLFFSSMFLLPSVLIQIWFFFIPGLYIFEVQKWSKFISLFLLFQILSFFIFWYFIFPLVCKFLLTYEQTNSQFFIKFFFEGRIQEYLDVLLKGFRFIFVLTLIYIFILYFFLLFTLNTFFLLLQFRKYVYIFVLFLIVNLISYDLFSMICAMFCIFFFLELVIYLNVMHLIIRQKSNY